MKRKEEDESNESDKKKKKENLDLKHIEHLPYCIKSNIENEIITWKREIFEGLKTTLEKKNNKGDPPTLVRINRYIDLKYPLSNTEKEEIVKMMFEILLFPNIDMDLQTKYARVLCSLLKKKENLNLKLPWRPLYDIINSLYFSKYRKSTYTPKELVKKIKRYFHENATDEIFEELRPILSLTDHIIFKAQGFLTLFLPTNTKRSDWIDECMEMFSWIGLYPTYDQGFTSLFSSLCKESLGSLDLEKYLPFLFGKFLKFFDIPIGNSPLNIYDEYPSEECSLFEPFELTKSLLMTDMAKLIVWLFSPKSQSFSFFQKLLKSIEFYYHPSNEGTWTQNLGDFLLVLCSKFVKRVKKEKSMEPKDYHISEKIQKDFVNEILPIVFTAVYSKSSQMTICGNHALKQLCYLAPDIVFPLLMDRYSHALTTLTEIHQTISVIESLSIIIFPFLEHQQNHIYLNDLISLTLPGIDVNDMRKTYSTLKFYISILMNIPLIESKSKKAPEVTLYFEEWCLQVLDRIITIISNQGPLQKDNPEGIPNSTFSVMFDILFNQLSPSIYQICLKKVYNFVSKEFSINAKKNIGHLLNSLVYANPESALQLFIPLCYENLLTKNQKLRDLTSNEIEWYLHILSQVVYRGGKLVLNYKTQIWNILLLTWDHSEKLIVKSSAKLIKNLLKCLTFYYPLEIKSSNPMEWNSEKFQTKTWEFWGKFTPIEDLYVQYHIPSEEEITFAIELTNNFMHLVINSLNGYTNELILKKKTTLTNKDAKNKLTYLKNIMKGASNIIPEIKQDIIPNYTKFQDTLKVSASTCFVDEKLLKYTYYHIANLCHDLIVSIGNNEQFSEVLSTLPKVIYTLFAVRGGTTSVSHAKEKSKLKFAKLSFFKSGHKSEDVKYPRYFMVKKIQLEVSFRYIIHNDSIDYTKSHQLLFNDLISLSYSNYSVVRKKSQNILVSCFKRFPIRVSQLFIPSIILTISNPKSTEDETTGAIYILEKLLQRAIISNPGLTLSLMLNLTKTHHVKKQSTQDRIMELFESLFHLFYQFPIESQEVLNQFSNDIFKVVDNNNLHWKYLVTIGTCFLLLVRSDSILLPPNAIEFIMIQLTSDIEKLRTLGYEIMNLILCQYKPQQPKKTIIMKNQTFIDKWSELKTPTNEKEWKETIFFDKNYFGWNICPTNTLVYDYSSQPPKVNPEILKLGKFFTKDFLDKFFELLVIREETFNETNAQTFKGFVQVYREEFIETIKPYLNELLNEAGSGKREEIFYMSSAAELIGGIVRGIKHWPFESQNKVIEYLISIFDVLDKCSVACIDEWCQCIEFCSSDRDPRRLKWLGEYLFSKFEKSISNETSQARYLKYYFSILDSIYWRDPKQTKKMITVLKDYIHHPYEQVREIISLLLSSIFKSHWKPPRDNVTNLIVNKDIEYSIDFVDDFMKELFTQFNEYITKGKLKEEEFLSLSKLILSTVFNTFVSCVPCLSLKYLNEIIFIHCIILENSDEEIQNNVKGNLIFIASFPMNEKYTLKTFDYIKNVLITNKQWKVKTTLLQFLQIFGFKQQFYLKDKEETIFQLLVDLLQDSQFEVRELACETLAGFFKFSNEEMIHKYYELFKKSISKKEKNHMIRYSGILGISAIIRAFPYDIPNFMPQILVEFANYSQDEHQISDVVRKTFSEFWRLHGDTWHIEKKKLTEDQLMTLTDQLFSPSYYA